MTRPPFAIVILAAGSSTRFGSPKQVAHYRDKPLISWAMGQALKANASQIIVVANSNFAIDDLPSEVEILLNQSPETGLASSLSLGIQAVKSEIEICLVTLGDQPLVEAPHLLQLVDSIEGDKTVAGSTYSDGSVGVPAAFNRTHFHRLASLTGDQGAKAVLRENQSECARVQLSPAAQIDIDYPADLIG